MCNGFRQFLPDLASSNGRRAGRVFGLSRGRQRGFTLVEAATATVIIGVAFTALLQLLAVGTVSNREGANLTTGVHLANNIHEAAIRVPYADLFALERTYSPAVDARMVALPGMTGWSQVVDVSYVDASLLTSAVPDTQYEPTARVTVSVVHNGKQVYRTSWLAAASE
jgi:prepilin-type N-terminal cleavage/methylation domain-containing protein